MQIEMNYIDPNSKQVEAVIQLADRNTATLGFISREAIRDMAYKRQIIVALASDTLAGYVIFRLMRSTSVVKISYLCVDDRFRGHGIADRLVQFLSTAYQAYYGIGLLCRTDYQFANNLWSRLGFEKKYTKPGRAEKEPTTLAYWYLSHGHPTLFDLAPSAVGTLAAIDMNVFLDIAENDSSQPNSLQLVADTFQEDIRLCVTAELESEIRGDADVARRRRNLDALKQYDVYQSRSPRAQFQNLVAELQSIWSEKRPEAIESDIRHLVHAAHRGIAFFVTRDRSDLLSKASEIFAVCHVEVMSPTQFLLTVQEMVDGDAYHGKRLAGTLLKEQRLRASDLAILPQYFQLTDIERRSAFEEALNRLIALDKQGVEIFIALDVSEVPLALYALDWGRDNMLEIPLLRTRNDRLAATVGRYLIYKFIKMAVEQHKSLVRIREARLPGALVDAAVALGFVDEGDALAKVNLDVIAPRTAVRSVLATVLNDSGVGEPSKDELIRQISFAGQHEDTRLEKQLFPLKIQDSNLPCYTISIKHTWAERWFDEKLAQGTLFGAESNIAFNVEGVYYRANTGKVEYPARMLWYVMHDKNVPGTKAIRACSMLNEVIVDNPKALFKRFEHLGIYQWADVYKTAQYDVNRPIMALRFSHTELFERPVEIGEISEVVRAIDGKNHQFQGLAKVSAAAFLEIYTRGMSFT